MTMLATSAKGVSPRPPLFPHQEKAIEWLHARDRAALFIDMGGG